MCRTVADIASAQLCTSCGACVVVCPVDAIQMDWIPAGLLRPAIDEAQCTSCGLCVRNCPGRRVAVGSIAGADVFSGVILSAYLGNATSGALRQGGQSGGVVTALGSFLLDEGDVDGVIAVDMPEDSSLLARGVVARESTALVRTQKSKYSPVALVSALRECRPDERLAFVGLPCQIHGVRNLTACRLARIPQPSITIGLVCDRTLMGIAADVLACDAGLDRARVQSLKYRDTERIGWPGELSFRMESGECEFASSDIRHGIKEYVTPPRCRVCFDKLNVLADIVVGDPWGVDESADGSSVILIRTDIGRQLIERALEHGVITANSIRAEAVLAGQRVDRQRSRYLGYSLAWDRRNLRLPQVVGMASVQHSGAWWMGLSERLWLAVNLWVASSPTRTVALQRVSEARVLVRLVLRAQKVFGWLRRYVTRSSGGVTS